MWEQWTDYKHADAPESPRSLPDMIISFLLLMDKIWLTSWDFGKCQANPCVAPREVQQLATQKRTRLRGKHRLPIIVFQGRTVKFRGCNHLNWFRRNLLINSMLFLKFTHAQPHNMSPSGAKRPWGKLSCLHTKMSGVATSAVTLFAPKSSGNFSEKKNVISKWKRSTCLFCTKLTTSFWRNVFDIPQPFQDSRIPGIPWWKEFLPSQGWAVWVEFWPITITNGGVWANSVSSFYILAYVSPPSSLPVDS